MAAAALMGVGVGLDIFGSIKNAQAQKEQAEFQAKQNEFNSKIADIQAQDAIARGDQAAQNLQQQASAMQGTQKAAAASQGIDVGSGDAQDLIQETGKMSRLDVLTIKNNAAREAFGYKAQAANYYNQAQMNRKTGSAAATGSILTSGANAFSRGANYAIAKSNPYERNKP